MSKYLDAIVSKTAAQQGERRNGTEFSVGLSADSVAFGLGQPTTAVAACWEPRLNRAVALTPELLAAIMAEALAITGMGTLPAVPNPDFAPVVADTLTGAQQSWQQVFEPGDMYYRIELTEERFVEALTSLPAMELLDAEGVTLAEGTGAPLSIRRLLPAGTYYVKATATAAGGGAVQITAATPTTFPTPAVTLAEGEVAAWYVADAQVTTYGVTGTANMAIATNLALGESIQLTPGQESSPGWGLPTSVLVTITGPATSASAAAYKAN